jgi:hypothetical protein
MGLVRLGNEGGWTSTVRAAAILIVIVAVIVVIGGRILRYERDSNEADAVVIEMSAMYSDHVSHHGRGPVTMADLENAYSTKYPKALDALKQGRWTFAPEIKLTQNPYANGDRLIAWESTARSSGGSVLFGDSRIRHMDENSLEKFERQKSTRQEIGAMYLAFARSRSRPPSSIEDLDGYREVYPEGYRAIASKAWTVRWNTKPSNDRVENYDRVIAYANGPEDEPGRRWLLVADGSSVLVPEEDLQTWIQSPEVLH